MGLDMLWQRQTGFKIRCINQKTESSEISWSTNKTLPADTQTHINSFQLESNSYDKPKKQLPINLHSRASFDNADELHFLFIYFVTHFHCKVKKKRTNFKWHHFSFSKKNFLLSVLHSLAKMFELPFASENLMPTIEYILNFGNVCQTESKWSWNGNQWNEKWDAPGANFNNIPIVMI